MRVIILLCRLANDIEINPGPQVDTTNIMKLHRKLSVCHLNIQSMKRNKEKVKHVSLKLGKRYDIITLSETWLTLVVVMISMDIIYIQYSEGTDQMALAGT